MDNIRDQYLEGRFERTEEGVYFPRARLLAQGVFAVCKRGEPVEYSPNIVTDEGLDYLLEAGMRGNGANGAWYIALHISGTPDNTWTAANYNTGNREWVNYTAAPGAITTHPAWTDGGVSGGTIDSFASKAEFTSTADSQTIVGAAIMSQNTRPTVSGTLVAASNFASAKSLDTNEILDVGYGLTLTAVP